MIILNLILLLCRKCVWFFCSVGRVTAWGTWTFSTVLWAGLESNTEKQDEWIFPTPLSVCRPNASLPKHYNIPHYLSSLPFFCILYMFAVCRFYYQFPSTRMDLRLAIVLMLPVYFLTYSTIKIFILPFQRLKINLMCLSKVFILHSLNLTLILDFSSIRQCLIFFILWRSHKLHFIACNTVFMHFHNYMLAWCSNHWPW